MAAGAGLVGDCSCSLSLCCVALAMFRRWQREPCTAGRAARARCLRSSEYLSRRDLQRLAKQLSELLRRGMLAYAPREEVAGLTGNAWLAWLDRGMPLPYFHTEGGKSLLDLPYRDPEGNFSDGDVNALVAAVRMRLSVPLGGTA